MKTKVFLGISLVIIISFGIWLIFPNESDELIELDVNRERPLTDQIENWSLYQEDSEITVGGTGDCGNAEYTEFFKKVNSGSRKVLLLNNVLELVITPNYEEITNEQFLAWNSDDTAICVAGGIYPYYAYKDKLLWKGVCSTGYIPPENSSDYQRFQDCLEAEEAVEKYFSTTENVPNDWLTFESDNFGYQISYPSDWFLEEGNQFDNIITDFYLSPEQCGENDACMSRFVVILTVADKGCYTAEDCAEVMPYSAICSIAEEREQVTIDQFSAIEQYEYPEENCGTESIYQKVVYWIRDNTLYTLQGLDDSAVDYRHYAETFELIKDSIDFL